MSRSRVLRVVQFSAPLAIAGFVAIGCGGGGGGGGGGISTPPALAQGLIHWWKLAGNTVDSAGTLNSSAVGAVTYAAAPSGMGAVFNGTTTGVSLPATPDMQFQASFTLSAWAMLKSYPTAGQLWATIIFEGDDNPGSDPYYLQVDPSGTLQFQVCGKATSAAANAPTQFPLDKWVFVTGTYDKAAGLETLYENGVQVAQTTKQPALTPVIGLADGYSAGIGIGVNNGFPYSIYDMGWNGELSDLRVYNRALSAAEVKELYTNDGGANSG